MSTLRPHPGPWVRSLLLASLAGPAAAQTPSLPAVDIAARPVVEESSVDLFSASSETIGLDQLRDQNAVDLASALRRTPGVQISRYNPVGAFGGDQGGAVYIRGMGVSRPGSEIKTYVDGVPFYMGLWSHPLLDLLPVNGMQSITVHKSPQPYRSGNNFASIDLETRRATEDGVHGDVRVSGGSFGTFTEQFNLLGRQGDLDWSLTQGHAESDGHRPHADGRLDNVMGRIGYRLDANWSIAASLLHVDNQARDPGDSRAPASAVAPEYNTRASLLSTSLSHVHGTWRGEVKLYGSRGRGDWLHQPAPDGDSINKFRMSGLRWKEQFTPWEGGTVVAGIDHDRVSGDAMFNRIAPAPSGFFDAPTFRITSPYVAVHQDVPLSTEWTLVPSAGLRFYDHSQFPSKTAPHAGLSLVSEQWTVFANIARGINYPGLETPLLASLIAPLGESWKRLSAEELDHAEVGFKWKPSGATEIGASLFHDKFKNRYVFGFPPDVPPPPQFINLGTYSMRGAELSVRQALGREWSVFAGLTLLDPSADHLPYSPKRAVTLGANGQAGPWRIAIDAQYQSEVWALSRSRAASASNTERVASFAVANARFAYPVPALGKQGEVFLAVENLFDRSYAFRPGYPMPGRSAQIGLTASF
ncbi:TonB-dependent receptor domain-containing protein [Paracidovorax anthurii]|uniref:Iron complex outermembrane receptor protein n=1 Tax=Paracidovorax anthurii TaxID=78229 RepID=A0A328YSY6_9BURK|nr:TonB-dependent receptor [Paracidovorax anthurii]RAR75292.1 iron complex outermembrane receptor protein [Paracidovorax anthurii]